jgi:hypothetical protein
MSVPGMVAASQQRRSLPGPPNSRQPSPLRRQTSDRRRPPRELLTWVRVQRDNAERHAAALRPFSREEFGRGPEAPTEGHIQATNSLMSILQEALRRQVREVQRTAETAVNTPSTAHLRRLVSAKENAHRLVTRAEQVWDFYFELFGQRQSRFGSWLLGCDRIALDCYQYAYLGLGQARSIPAPPAFSYMRTGFSPATFRRGIPLRRLGRRLNPFPLIQLPYHRLVNPWTLGAVLHEVAHNLQNDLGLAAAVPAAIGGRLRAAGMPPAVVSTWTRWNRETFADMCGVLFGGPAVVGSLMDVIGRSHRSVTTFVPGAPHPTPFLRAFVSTELLRRMGFADDAKLYESIWARTYVRPHGGIPRSMLATFSDARRLVVDTICYQRFPSLGDRTLSQVLRFEQKEQQMIEEAARRLAQGNDPGVVPERFLIGAARFAMDRRLATPEAVTQQFYRELARR